MENEKGYIQSINKKGYIHPYPSLFIKTSLEKRLEIQSCIDPVERLIRNLKKNTI
jgi:hypothetical protein